MIRAALAALMLVPSLALAATATPSPLNFGGQSMGTTSPALTVTFTNTQGVAITIGSIVASAQFGQTNNCGSSVAANASCTINVTFTPAVGGANLNDTTAVNGTLTITSSATSSPNTVTLAGTGERSLVSHYYRSILRRAPDSGGKAFWQGETTRVASLGLNVNEVWYALSSAFFVSAEYAAFNRSNTDFITDLYVTFFNRQPDSGGLSFWNSNLSQGMPREVALAEFMFSTEFRNFTQGIFGSTAVRAEIDAVTDFFRGFLARLPDDGGFNFWVGRFRTAQCQSSAAVTAEVEAISSAFALSAEYAARARSNSQYAGDLYNAFLRRGGDLAGVQFWIGQLNSGAQTREQLRVAFKNSAEFQARVTAITNQGCFTPQLDCASAAVLCVGGAQSEYATIQAAINAASPAAGKTVLVFDGNYAGFSIASNRGGTVGNAFTVKAQGQNAVITSANSNAEGVSIRNASHVVVEGFRMSGMPEYGIGCHDAPATNPMQNVTIRNNHVTNSGWTNIYCSNAASLIEGNTAGNSVTQHGIYVANGGADNTIVRGNTIYNSAYNSLHVNGDLSVGGDGVITGMLIEDNVIYGGADNAINMDGLRDSTIRNNLIYDNLGNGIRGYRVDASAGPANMRVVNNTIVVPAAADAGAVKFTADGGGHTIFNNILINLGTDRGTIVTGNTNFMSDRNIVVNHGFSVNEGNTMLNFTNWKALAGGYDANSTISTIGALFVDPAAGNYRLKAGAPAANTGVATFNGVAAPLKDIAGVTRPVGGVYDRGAFESF